VSNALTTSSFATVALVSFWTVFIAELVGDKSIYSVTSLSLRFRASAVFTGITIAFAAKMMIAVLLVRLLVQIHFWTDFVSAVAFFVSAFLLWIKEPDPVRATGPAKPGWFKAVVVSFAALFFIEWADPSQVALAALSVRSHSLLAPWLGGTLAMATKGGMALAVGIKLRDRISQKLLRAVATASFLVLGILALSGLIFR
jgi:putative Ca2+/H+ antiporter (TMEM165/GDT1 family)